MFWKLESRLPSLVPWVTAKGDVGWATPALEPTGIQAEPSPPAKGDHTDTLTEMGKRKRQDQQDSQSYQHWVKILG